MRIIALILNFTLLLGAAYVITISDGPWRPNEYIAAILLLTAPASALLALLVGAPESWFALYVQRKRLEEQQKIESLRKDV